MYIPISVSGQALLGITLVVIVLNKKYAKDKSASSSTCRVTTHYSSTERHTPSQLHCIPLNLQSYTPEVAQATLEDGPQSVSAPHNHIWCQHHYIFILSCLICSGPFQFLVCLDISSVTMELLILGPGLQMVWI